MTVRILVSAASKCGSTVEIGTCIAETLRRGLPEDTLVEVLPAADVDDVAPYDAIVLGSAIYMGRWLPDARQAAARIAAHPPRQVWLFSSGPIGDPPKPDEQSVDVSDLITTTNARGHAVFAGRLDRRRLGFTEKAMVMALRVADGDFRDWDAIAAWAGQVADALNPPGRPTLGHN